MSASTVIVAVNAQLLRRTGLKVGTWAPTGKSLMHENGVLAKRLG